MTSINEWASRHGVSQAAVQELKALLFDIAPHAHGGKLAKTEQDVVNLVRLEASAKSGRLWRNNVGAAQDATGRVIRYGIANDSKELNRQLKSSDLLGIMPVLITPAHVGRTLGRFVARECKHPSWKPTGDEHEMAQLRFINLINQLGGDARFATGEGTL